MNPSVNHSYPNDDDAIDEAASQWIVERAEGLDPEQTLKFEEWLRADPRHTAAIERMEQTHALLARLPFAAGRLDEAGKSERSERPARGGWGWRWPAGLAAAAAFALVAGWPGASPGPATASVRYATASGGYERAELNDGSIVELNANSEVKVDFAAGERRVTLLAGEAHFHVARDEKRPFVVTAGDYSVRAVGTAFSVRLAPVAVEVLVTHGKVLVSQQETKRAAPVPSANRPMLEAGQRVVIEPGAPPSAQRVETVAPEALRAALAWQERRLVFTDTPLREVVDRFNQRNRTRLVLGDSELGSRLVGGVFAVDNVEAFVRLLEDSGDIVSERQPGGEIVLHLAK